MAETVRHRPAIKIAGVIMLVLTSMATALVATRGAFAEPTEVDLPASPPVRRAAARPAQATAPAATVVRPPSKEEGTASAAAPPAQSAAAAEAGLPRPRAYFPYTIRSGDTLEGIAAEFGVEVADLMRVNRRVSDDNLMAGDTIRIPNPSLVRERELNAEIDRLTIDVQESAQKARAAENALASVRERFAATNESLRHYQQDIASLPWWRAAAWSAAVGALLMFGITLAAIVEWLILRARYRAVAEMNEALRRLDQKYRLAMARAELRLQELYGRRRRGIEDGRERPKLPEEIEIERLDHELKQVLDRHLARLGPGGRRMRRARWRELMGGVGAPVEVRTVRR